MAHLKKISIKGFKSILDQEIELGRLNIFIGTNGAGKSNLLEAIAMLSASIEGGIDYERLSRRGARLSSPEIFRSAFRNKDRKSTFSIDATTDNIVYRMSINAVDGFSYHSESLKKTRKNTSLCGRSNNGATINGVSLKSNIDREKSIIPVYQAFENSLPDLSSLEKFSIYAPSTPILRGVATDNSSKSPLGLYGGRLAESLRELINEASKSKELFRFFKLLDWFRSIGTREEADSKLISEHISLGRNVVTYTDKFMKTNFNELYAYDVSEGALYILFVLVLLSHKESPDFLALDNVDNTLNPGLVRNLMEQISDFIEKDKNKQVLLTTHNPTTLDAVDLFNEEHRLFVVSRNKDGHTQIKRISPPEGMDRNGWQKTYYGMKLSQIWLSGAIGGLTPGF
ncbi:AAA family ATPase [Candidatus Venteria ishoeyi]|uniref:AAA family ATPase n=1 Tax=Candidatus Venteria ishoeyi TaxID=1899563 RepID=UPI0025A5352E|nr:ATP-binding protein [Candidatus Venteria ishoeyi]MDM8547547.1 AAA family ATPase [Candidatus Venteria ishoeyi]